MKFPDLVPFCEFLANEGKVVLVAALDGTFQRKVRGPSDLFFDFGRDSFDKDTHDRISPIGSRHLVLCLILFLLPKVCASLVLYVSIAEKVRSSLIQHQVL
jgi:hypothetical protein